MKIRTHQLSGKYKSVIAANEMGQLLVVTEINDVGGVFHSFSVSITESKKEVSVSFQSIHTALVYLNILGGHE